MTPRCPFKVIVHLLRWVIDHPVHKTVSAALLPRGSWREKDPKFGYHGQSRCGRNHPWLHFLCDSRKCLQLDRTLSHSITGERWKENTDGCKRQVIICVVYPNAKDACTLSWWLVFWPAFRLCAHVPGSFRKWSFSPPIIETVTRIRTDQELLENP